MPPILRWLIALTIVGGAIGWGLTRPHPLSADALEGLTGDPVAGEQVFLAAGCASCHVAPKGEGTEIAEAETDDGPVLSGGQRFPSDFGTFIAPNISTDPVEGVGNWTDIQLVNAIQKGVSPEGYHYYPAFPYDAYGKAGRGDIVNLIAYLHTLPASDVPSQPHEVGFPFNIRRGLGLWKLLFVSDDWVLDGPLDPEQTRGRYLVEALAHCGACHTPRNLLGGPETSKWLAGAPDPSGKGRVPGIAPGALDWSAEDIVYYLESGFTPDFDSVGGHMAAVVDKTSKLPESDRAAIAAYVKAVPAVK